MAMTTIANRAYPTIDSPWLTLVHSLPSAYPSEESTVA